MKFRMDIRPLGTTLKSYSGHNINLSLDDRYKYTRGSEGKTAKR
jgi:hypothetical protein